ncbi:calcium/proton exchanger [Dacryopinax primogenitus]|uniref:Calcium/proton exchanger n=1 Tax=Dacryopinax primogenitus (strain DJM 731) TaxID=1858805 RepID=M5GDM5_DACPD|nr:calcium/proton exchanger [Dacryopinax primogenitus]EJU04647.1 calcium/proton exchanger [Dacryopinax primogenitus]
MSGSTKNNVEANPAGQVWASPQDETGPFPDGTEPLPDSPTTIARRHSYPSRKESKDIERNVNMKGVPIQAIESRVPRRGKTTLEVVREHTSMLLKPQNPPPPDHPKPTWAGSLKAVVTASWLNVLLVCIPVGWALHFTSVTPIIVFIFTFLSIIPLAKLLAFATEEISLRVGQTLGGLLNATLGNAVELIVAIIALAQCKLTIVQSSLVGSILSNLLLVLGMCFFAGGTKYSEQGFLVAPAQLNSSLLVLSVIAVLLPAAFNMAITASNNADNNTSNDVSPQKEGHDILQMSHGVAVILLIIYACNLIFQLWSHANVLNEAASKSTAYPENINLKYQYKKMGKRLQKIGRQRSKDDEEVQSEPGAATASTTSHEQQSGARQRVPVESAEKTPGAVERAEAHEETSEAGEEPEYPTMNFATCVILLIVVTVLVGVTAEFLVDSIDGVTATGHISEEWVGLILLPIVGNAAEHVTAVTVSVKNKLDLSMGVAVGSSIQIALFVIPFIVVLAWIMGKPLTMLFDPFESVVLFLAVLTVNYVVADGRSNWLEGMILMNLYAIVAVAFWFYPGFNPSSTLGLTC